MFRVYILAIFTANNITLIWRVVLVLIVWGISNLLMQELQFVDVIMHVANCYFCSIETTIINYSMRVKCFHYSMSLSMNLALTVSLLMVAVA